jgi:hypothetical protein
MEKPKGGPEHENKREIPKRKMEFKTGITDWQRLNTKGMNNRRSRFPKTEIHRAALLLEE